MAYTLQTFKATLHIEINQAAQDAIIAGFDSSALGAPYRYESDQFDQLNLIGAAQLGIGITYRCVRLADGVEDYFAHTNAQLQQVLADGATRKLSLLQQAKAGRDSVDAAADETAARVAADAAIAAIGAL